MKLSQIADAVGARIENASPDADISGVSGIDQALPGQLTFVHNPKYAAAAKTTRATAVILDEKFPAISTGMLRTNNPYLAWAKAVELFYQAPRYAPGIHPTAIVHPSAKIGNNAHLGPYVTIAEDVEIGDHAVLLAHVAIYRGVKIGRNFFAHTHAVIREFCTIGDNVLLQNAVIIGSDGFGFAKDNSNHWHKIVQSGNVIVGDDVEIQANACIDRANVGHTSIARGAKLDNLVHIGHACTIGEDTLLCAQVGLAGTTDVGDNVILAGQVGSAGHLKIGDGVIAIPQSGIAQDVPARAMVSGTPAIDHKLWLRCCAVYPRLPEIAKAIRKLAEQK
ncbi:MAG: UDP-3-O-(3-hydroxymyristoyl)glucosamine N-acyltransferase [Terriglobales bacterium]